MTDLYFLIPVISQIFNSTAELVITIGMPTNEANAKIETTTGSRNENKKMFKVFI